MGTYIPDFRAGDTYRIKIQYPVGMDLTGFIHWLTLETTPITQIQSTFGDHTGDSANVCYIELTPAVTKLIAVGRYQYALKAKAPSGDESTIVPPPEEYRDRVFVAPQLTVEP